MNDIWDFIRELNEQFPGSPDNYGHVFSRYLENIKTESINKFSNEYMNIIENINEKKIWEVCSLISGAPSGDDIFLYFRNWLIWNGKDVLSVTKTEPDELKIYCDTKKISISNPYVESLCMLGAYANKKAAGLSNANFQTSSDWVHPSNNRMIEAYPNLWREYGNGYQSKAPGFTEGVTMHVPGLGVLRIGDSIINTYTKEVGKIKKIPIQGRTIAVVEFNNAERNLDISSEFFSIVKS
jgi:hypothetical protein